MKFCKNSCEMTKNEHYSNFKKILRGATAYAPGPIVLHTRRCGHCKLKEDQVRTQTELLVFKWDKRRPHQAIRIDRIKDVFYPLFNALIFPYI